MTDRSTENSHGDSDVQLLQCTDFTGCDIDPFPFGNSHFRDFGGQEREKQHVPCPLCSLVASSMLCGRYPSHTQSTLQACCNCCRRKGIKTLSAYSVKVLTESVDKNAKQQLYLIFTLTKL